MNSNKTIAVLGRGPSLILFKEFSKQFEKVYIVNNFDVEIDFLGYDHFANKEIIHVCGNSKICFLSEKNYKRLNINSVRCNVFSPKQYLRIKQELLFLKLIFLTKEWLKRGYPPVPWNIIVQYIDKLEYDDLCEFLEREYKSVIDIEKRRDKTNDIRSWPTTGLLGIDIALFENNPENVYLFGFDFYKGDYLVKKNPYPHQTYDWDKSKIMRFHLNHLVKEFSNTKFYSSHSLNWSLANWNNL